VPIERLPLYARAGAEILMGPEMDYIGEQSAG
jgi:alpha-glucosidase (family GH31 glycosyl hydrolase)